MKLYIDTAIIEEIKEVHSWGVLEGVTTNPSLIVKSGRDFKETIIEICNLVKAPVSAEVTATDAQGMIDQGKEFAQWHDNVIIKLPCNPEGLQACATLSQDNIKTNLTLCFSVNQALLCARAGATYVSPFIGRLDDINHTGIELIREIKEMFDIHKIKTEIIAASVRTPMHVSESALAGADIATIPYKLFAQMIKHPLTTSGLDQFMKDWNSK